ncbi:hypothetical protein NJF54_09120 [Pseudomonas guariconensis]|uniref:DarT1-associated NADAR antitoxin family protein n=1 Tax=Pseudomonas guariconensis TaxID=1288410 RepID=UPI00209B22A9|nr:hypothetical protein [Pseudomonas guariconensis]MCO7631995.1 hypothetical protein [Pseudomonas guariconensis]
MANRPVFSALGTPDHLVSETMVSFSWNPGFAPVQKKKNVAALHEEAKRIGLYPLLEVSTKSDLELGRRLSAFSLKIDTEMGEISLEAAFQGSKVFENGGPYTDIYEKDAWTAKKDERLKSSGKLIGFDFFGQEWPLVPKTAFYDWLYLSALQPHQEFLKRLNVFKGFTDIEFNPERSINCQARTCALLVSLIKIDALNDALKSQSDFIAIVASDSFKQSHSTDLKQQILL